MLKTFRSLFSAAIAALALFLTLPAHAVEYIDYTDIWVDANATIGESGFGINFVQGGNSFDYIFATFFIYDPATGNPVWVTGELSRSSGITPFIGNIYRTQGDPTINPFAPKNTVTTPIGIVTFSPTSSTTGTLVYTITDPRTTTTLNLQRLTLTPTVLNGTYFGGNTVSSTNCSSSGNNKTYYNTASVEIAKQAGSTQATYTFTMQDDAGYLYTCTMKGTLIQEGRFQKINNASYVCYSGNSKVVDYTATLSNIAATTQGIEGQWTSNKGWGNCKEDAHFAAVLVP
ncbi:MAG: hypothetical protein LBB65_08335 [Burkholderiales bacterium]|jgi:hypothetical protein|nr:hypothetical protein [Burkholderiales bacterium]